MEPVRFPRIDSSGHAAYGNLMAIYRNSPLREFSFFSVKRYNGMGLSILSGEDECAVKGPSP